VSGLFVIRHLLALAALAQVHAADPITTRTDAVGQRLNTWANQGTAAGLTAITYENRDGQHSAVPTHLWPGLNVHAFSAEDQTAGRSKGPAQAIRSVPTLGNCSMAAPADRGGSLPRLYFMDPGGNRFLTQQFLANQLFVYPEHQDHDPGGNGIAGWGDLYPLNSPALLISQGSSGSDQPFLQALLSTTAAFPPATQRTLIDRRLLSPTLQAILRKHNRVVKTPADYLTGQAHPVVFDASYLDEEAMIEAAQQMLPTDIPPIALIDLIEETAFQAGTHFFEPENPHPHQLSTTPASIARLFRGNQATYEMVLSTAKSGDLLNRPITIRTAVLQGDPSLIEVGIEKNRPILRIKVRWQPPLTVTHLNQSIRSHRVDIGIFADNGVTLSAPAILSFYFLPNERRFYDDQGRISEICYLASNPELGLPTSDTDLRWLAVLKACIVKADGLRSTLMERAFEPEERAALAIAYSKLSVYEKRLTDLTADPARTADEARNRALFHDALRQVLTDPLPGSRALSGRATLETAFAAISRFTDLYLNFQQEIDQLAAQSSQPNGKSQLDAEVQRLIDWGVLLRQANGQVTALHPAAERSAAENYYLTALNLTVLSHALYPDALHRSADSAWADPRLTTRKSWRDLYRYDPDTAELIGWIRHHRGRTTWFNPQGERLPEGPGPSTTTEPVIYLPDPDQGLRFDPAK